MHQLKHQAQMMKEALLKGRIHEIGEILDFGFRQKQQMAEGISNPLIEELYESAKKAGATGGKISGAGGGGFMTFYVRPFPNTRSWMPCTGSALLQALPVHQSRADDLDGVISLLADA